MRYLLVLLTLTITLTGSAFAKLPKRQVDDRSGEAKDAPPLVPGQHRSSSKSAGLSTPRQRRQANIRFSWDVDESRPISRVEISLDDQRIRVFQNGDVVASGPVSSGKEGYRTPSGNFRVTQKERDHKSNLYGSFVSGGRIINHNASAGENPPDGADYEPASMPFYMRLTGDGVGMHAGFLPGYAASHGCIRLPYKLAEKLYSAINIGTPVDIVP